MLRVEWDKEKDEINRRKHRIGFETAKLVFDDPNCLTSVERVEDGEERWHAIGVSNMPKLSEKQREDILAMTGQRDEDIDYSDLPPVREIPANAVRGRFYRGRAIYLTDELHAYLSTIAMRRGVSLNDLVNNVLSQEVAMVEALK